MHCLEILPYPIHFLQFQSISYFVKFEIRKRLYATNVILLVFRTLRHSVRADGVRTRLEVGVLCDTRVDNRNDGRGNVTVPWNGHRWPTFKGIRAIIVICVGWQSISSRASDVCVRSGSAEMIKYTFTTSRRYCFGDCGGNNPDWNSPHTCKRVFLNYILTQGGDFFILYS